MNELLFLLIAACNPTECITFYNEFGLNIMTHNTKVPEKEHTIDGQTVWVWHYKQDKYQPTGFSST